MKVQELDNSAYPECLMGTPVTGTVGRPERSDTLHLSTIYKDMEETMFQNRVRKGEVTEDELAWYGAGGFLWEHVYGMAHREALEREDLVRPGEMYLDGITGSPDLVDLINWRLIELKFRWMSAWKFDQLEKYFWLELVQVKGYCKMAGMNEAELWVFFVNGDYRPPRPNVRGNLLTFSDQEIDESWGVILQHARRKGWL